MKLYKIRNWEKFYENNRSREIKNIHWVPIPNKHDGENFREIMIHKDGAMIYSAFVIMVQIASKCYPRGCLIKGSGMPHNSHSLALKCGAPAAWFDISIDYLIRNTDWLESEQLTTIPQEGAGIPQEGVTEGKGRNEQNEEKEELPLGAEKALKGYQKHPGITNPLKHDLLKLWNSEFPDAHGGRKYHYIELNDDGAINSLLTLMMPQEIMDVARLGWKSATEFIRTSSSDFKSLNSQWNKIQTAVKPFVKQAPKVRTLPEGEGLRGQ